MHANQSAAARAQSGVRQGTGLTPEPLRDRKNDLRVTFLAEREQLPGAMRHATGVASYFADIAALCRLPSLRCWRVFTWWFAS